MVIYYSCSNCGYRSLKWLGRCPQCGNWESFIKEEEKQESVDYFFTEDKIRLSKLSDIQLTEQVRIPSGFKELDRVLGGGFVLGSTILIGGHPGIGKSTLCLQIARFLSKNLKVIYVSGEESFQQIKLRAQRLKDASCNLYIISSTNLKKVLEILDKEEPQFIILDSIQAVYLPEVSSGAGSVSQVRECASLISRFSKSHNIPLLLIGHVTKEGLLAGPKMLEHMVDVVLYFEEETASCYRIIRSQKNRFGASGEIAVFEMTPYGLKEVLNPSSIFLPQREEGLAGSSISCIIEGTRPILVEIQALVCKSNFSIMRRRAEGIDYNRFLLLLAVIEKKGGVFLSNQDVFIKVAGGLRIEDPASDLAVVSAVYCGFKDRPLASGSCFIGEISLSGDLRSPPFLLKRIQEIRRLGFLRCFLASKGKEELKSFGKKGIEFVFINHIRDLFNILK